jgi:DNA polymerase (family 10)
MVNKELSRIFDQMADLLEITGGDRFRVNSFRRVARTIGDLTEDVTELAESGELKKIPGVGKGTVDRINEYLSSGQITQHAELLASLPDGLPELLEIPGLGPKKVQLLHEKLGIGHVSELKSAIEEGKLEELEGFGAKSVERIAEGIAFMERSAGRVPLGVALPIALELRDTIAAFPGVRRVEIAGSVRRGKETIGDLDLLCIAGDGKKVIDTFSQLPQATATLAAGKTKGSILVTQPEGGEIQVDLRVVAAGSFGAAMQYFTGSKEHNVRLREIAIKKGYRLNEYALAKNDKPIAGKDEEGIYKKLGLKFIPPELREDRGEVECKGDVPNLVTMEDIRGDMHLHTTASDGHFTIEEMAQAAKAFGYSYIAVTEHSKSSAIANGLPTERLLKHADAIRKADKNVKGITILAGIECDILANATLDYPDKVLAQLDFVIASIHGAMKQSRDKITARCIAAMENPYVHALGHPSGRLLGRREAMDLDWDAVIDAAACTGTALEINAAWQRLDLKDVHVRKAMDAGCWLVICTDAHHVDQYDQMALGVQTARRGWATKDRVINTFAPAALKKWLGRKRDG